MDFNKLKLKFEPEEEKEEEEKEYNWESLKAKFEPEPIDDITTPAPATIPIQTRIGMGAKAVGGAILPKPKSAEEMNKERLLQKFKTEVPSSQYGISELTTPEKLSGIEKGVRVLSGAVKQLPKQIKAAVLSISQGAKGASVANKDWADEYIESAKKDQEVFVQDMIDKYGDINILPGIKLSDVAQMPQSMAFSATSMGAGLAVGVPTALIPLPGTRILAWGLGTYASGRAAYEMSAYQIMQTYLDVKNEEKIATTGQGLTLEEENNLKQGFNKLAKQYALWEAVPEAISNLAFVGLLTAPLTKMVGKTIAGRIINKVAALYGEEVLTEIINEIGQKGVMGKAGLPGGGEVDWTSPTEWVEAFKAVAPQTFLLTTIMGGTGTLIINTNKVVKSLKNEVKDGEVKAKLIKKVENKKTLKEAVEEDIEIKELTPEEIKSKREMLLKRGIKEELLTDEFVKKAKIVELPKADVTTEKVTKETIGKLEKKWGEEPELTKEKVLERIKPIPPSKGKVSKIAKSIEEKSIEQNLTKEFGHLAEYTPIVIKEQAQRASDLINNNIDEARRVIRGKKPLPEGLKGTALITAMEEHIKNTADGELASELAASPLVSGTSAAAQELRLAAERDPASPVKAIEDINKELEKTAKRKLPGKILGKAKADTVSKIKNNIKNANTTQSWKAFIESIRC